MMMYEPSVFSVLPQPSASARSITEMFCFLMVASPRTIGLSFGMTVSFGQATTSRTLKTFMP